jgi:LPS export ABC transporter protein LptC
LRKSIVFYLRRSLAWIILLVLLTVLANFLYTRYVTERVEGGALPILSPEIVQSASNIETIENRDTSTRLRIQASRYTKTRSDKQYLQDICASEINPDGSVHNRICSRNAESDTTNQTLDFNGDVRLYLGKEIEIRMETLHYDLQSHIGTTPDPVEFYSERINGKARGLRYDRNQQSVQLDSEIDFLIAMEKVSADGSIVVEEFKAVSEKAFGFENFSKILLLGDARLESDLSLLTGDKIDVAINTELKKITSLISTGSASYTSKSAGESRSLSGDRIVFSIHPETGNLETIRVVGTAGLVVVSPTGEQYLSGAEIKLYLDPIPEIPTKIEGRTGVQFRFKHDTDEILIGGEWFSAGFSSATRKLENIKVRQNGKIAVTGKGGFAGNEIQAEKIDAYTREISGGIILDKLRAEQSARWTSRPVPAGSSVLSAPARTMTASLIAMFFAPDGGYLDRIDASGDVVLSEASGASANVHEQNTIQGDRVRFNFYSGNNQPKDMSATGHVRVVHDAKATMSDSTSKSGGFVTESDSMKAAFVPGSERVVIAAASQWGHFSFKDASRSATSEKCDYNAEKDRLTLSGSPEISFEMGTATGEIVEFNRGKGVVAISRKVRSVLSSAMKGGLAGSPADSQGIVLADGLQYWTETKRVRYTGNVKWLSADQQLMTEALEISDNGSQIKAGKGVSHYIYRKRVSIKDSKDMVDSTATSLKESRNDADMPIHIKSSDLNFSKDRNILIYSGNVSLVSGDLNLTSGILEAVLDKEGKGIEKAAARNKVVVRKGKRECIGDTAYYYGNPERFQVTGNPAELYDPKRGRSFALRLTSNVADDRILLGGRSE